MKQFFLALWVASFFLAGKAFAQWGAGVWGGNQACPYAYGAAKGSTDDDDTIQNLKQTRSKLQKEYDRKKRKQDDIKRKKSRLEKDIRRVLLSPEASVVLGHMEDRERGNGSYARNCTPGNVTSADSPGLPRQEPPRSYGRGRSGGTGPYSVNGAFCREIQSAGVCEWAGYSQGVAQCDVSYWTDYAQDGGRVDPEVCNSQFTKTSASVEYRLDCKAAIEDYGELSEQYQDIASDLANLKEQIRDYERSIERERDRVASRDEDPDDESESRCRDCEAIRRGYARTPTTLETVGNIGLSILGGVLAYKGAKYSIDQNSRLGWPTSPYLTAAMGYPFLMNGIYGALGGGIGGGVYACAGGAFGGGFGMGPMGMMGNMGMYGGLGGAFGYPGGMMGPGFGAGLYMPGMGPWGMAGPWGSGGLMPGMGMLGGFGLLGGYGMMPGYGGMMGGYGMMPGYGGMGGYGMMPGYGGMGGYGMMPGYGGMGGYGMMPGYGGMMPGYGMMGGYGGMMGGMDMQTQMQQMQVYMAQQQQAQQDMMARTQTVQRLQSQLYQIQMQIQQITYGGYGSTGYGLGGYSSTYPTGLSTGTSLTSPAVDPRGGNIR